MRFERDHRSAMRIDAFDYARSPLVGEDAEPRLLDRLSVTPYAAYSFRKLRNAYSGPCCKVRTAAATGDYTDISFGADGWVDEAEIAAVGDPVYVLFYDQSGNGNHQTQLTTNSVPPIALNTLNGKPSVDWDTAYANIGDLSSFTEGEIFRLMKRDADPPVGTQGLFWVSMGGDINHIPYISGTIFDGFGSTARKTTADPTPSLASWSLYSVYSAPNDWANYVNGTQIFSTVTNTVSFPASFYFQSDGELNTGEDILFDAKLSTEDRDLIFADIEAAYGLSF